MGLKNSAAGYGSIAKWLHWLTALLILGSYLTVYYRHWFTQKNTPENWTALQLHLSIGVTIAALVVLRIAWKIANRAPQPEPGPRWARVAANLGHLLLYAVLIVMPVTGYLGTGADIEYFFLYDITSFKNTDYFAFNYGQSMTFDEFEKPLDFVHKEITGAWLVWILVAGHAAAALYHHFVLKDRTLRKMTTGA